MFPSPLSDVLTSLCWKSFLNKPLNTWLFLSHSASRELKPRQIPYGIIHILWMKNLRYSDDSQFAKCHTHLVKGEMRVETRTGPIQNTDSIHHTISLPAANWIMCHGGVLTLLEIFKGSLFPTFFPWHSVPSYFLAKVSCSSGFSLSHSCYPFCPCRIGKTSQFSSDMISSGQNLSLFVSHHDFSQNYLSYSLSAMAIQELTSYTFLIVALTYHHFPVAGLYLPRLKQSFSP